MNDQVDLVDLARNLSVGSGSYTQAVALAETTVVELQVVNLSGGLIASLEWSANQNNWRLLDQVAVGTGASNLTTPAGMTSGWLRVGFSADYGEPLILRVIASLFVPQNGSGVPAPPAPPIA